MTSNENVFVWAYLPGETTPVVAGVLYPEQDGFAFLYGKSYLERSNAISLGPDLPLADDPVAAVRAEGMPSSIRDALPDSWGRYVIQHQQGLTWEDTLPDREYMLKSGSNRVGAIDFQASPTTYTARLGGGSLVELADGAVAVEADGQIGADMATLVRNTLGTPGGSQPKAFVTLEDRQWLAKFSTEYDKTSPLLRSERAAIYLADKAGIDVPDARIVSLEGRGSGHALLMERFDRDVRGGRRIVLSGNTMTDFHRTAGGSYPELVKRMTAVSEKPSEVGPELFKRLALRIPLRIDDDHLRNVAVHWDGKHAEFTQAFDLCPFLTSATPMGLTDLGDGARDMNLEVLLSKHSYYDLSRTEATEILVHVMDTIGQHRCDAVEVSEMSSGERTLFMNNTATVDLAGRYALPKVIPPRKVLDLKPQYSASGQSRRGDQGLGKTVGGGNAGSFAAHRRTEADGSALGLPPSRD